METSYNHQSVLYRNWLSITHMCGRFNLTASSEQLMEDFQLIRPPSYQTSYNIPPGQKILNIVQLDDKSYKSVNLLWGLIPSWAKDKKISHQLFNARAETLTQKPSFRNAFKHRHCLIPATGFYEWQKRQSEKQAYHIYQKEHKVFAFAGLWEHWEHDSQTLYSCTIITRAATSFMEHIHDRMPVIIPKQHYNSWLDNLASPEQLKQLLLSDCYQDMQATPVSDWVNNPRHDDKDCLS